ncbi:MAG: polyprenyl diphosphate synthase [Tissierellia bacterium]|nr:polyprenyl diphosphate synthase [Tissierellia bacterium]
MNNMEKIPKERLPKHVGIIMDGNGRWAKKRGLPRALGHREGSNRVVDIVEYSYELGIEHLSLYAFSTENWKRPATEIEKLMELLSFSIKKHLERLKTNGVRIRILGDLEPFPRKLKKEIEFALLETEQNDRMFLNIGLNYGGQDECVRAAKKLVALAKDGKITLNDVTKEKFEECLYTNGQPPLDLLIRPSGELRVSNFMLYQLAYAEFWFSDILWPDFTKEVYASALKDFIKRNRRYGGL